MCRWLTHLQNILSLHDFFKKKLNARYRYNMLHAPSLGLIVWYFDSLTWNTYALLLNPLARGIEELLPAQIARSNWCFFVLRTSLVISTLCVAFTVPFFGMYIFWYLKSRSRWSLILKNINRWTIFISFSTSCCRSSNGFNRFTSEHSCGKRAHSIDQ